MNLQNALTEDLMDVRPKTSAMLVQTLLLLFVFIVVGIVLTKAPATSGRARAQEAPQSQQPDRIVVRKPWPVEPVRVIAVKTKKKENIEMGKAFDEDDDWLDGFTVTGANNYDKAVTSITISMVFRREPGDTRPPLAWNLHFGPSPITPEYKDRDPNKVIKAGKTIELSLSAQDYVTLKHDFEETGYPNRAKRVELVVREVGFEDGSMLHTGTLYVQDPANPNDPTKKIPVREPVLALSHDISTWCVQKPIRILDFVLRRSLSSDYLNWLLCRHRGCLSNQPISNDFLKGIKTSWTLYQRPPHC